MTVLRDPDPCMRLRALLAQIRRLRVATASGARGSAVRMYDLETAAAAEAQRAAVAAGPAAAGGGAAARGQGSGAAPGAGSGTGTQRVANGSGAGAATTATAAAAGMGTSAAKPGQQGPSLDPYQQLVSHVATYACFMGMWSALGNPCCRSLLGDCLLSVVGPTTRPGNFAPAQITEYLGQQLGGAGPVRPQRIPARRRKPSEQQQQQQQHQAQPPDTAMREPEPSAAATLPPGAADAAGSCTSASGAGVAADVHAHGEGCSAAERHGEEHGDFVYDVYVQVHEGDRGQQGGGGGGGAGQGPEGGEGGVEELWPWVDGACSPEDLAVPVIEVRSGGAESVGCNDRPGLPVRRRDRSGRCLGR